MNRNPKEKICPDWYSGKGELHALFCSTSKNDFLDLNTVSCFSNLPDELKEFIYIKVSNKLNDFSADTTIGKFISNSDTMQMAFRYDPENNEFFLTTKRW